MPWDDARDRKYAERVIELASMSVAEDNSKPRPKVGAVIVKDGRVIAEGSRDSEGRHAEFVALSKLKTGDAKGATVYTSLEPCSYRGSEKKTPCAYRLVDSGVARVVIGEPDLDWRIRGEGLSILSANGIEICMFPPDLMENIKKLNILFSAEHTRPGVIMKHLFKVPPYFYAMQKSAPLLIVLVYDDESSNDYVRDPILSSFFELTDKPLLMEGGEFPSTDLLQDILQNNSSEPLKDFEGSAVISLGGVRTRLFHYVASEGKLKLNEYPMSSQFYG